MEDPQDRGVVRAVNKDFEFRIGMLFSDEEDAYYTYNAYAFSKGFGVRKGFKYFNRNNELRRCTFLCCCEGFNKVSPHVERKVVRTIKRCGCQARIKFKIERGVWEVIEFDDIHNHPFVHESQRHFMRSSRKITETKGSMLQTMVDSGIRPTKAYSYMVNEAGGAGSIGFTLRDCQNFLQAKRSNLISAGDCQSLLNHLQSLQSSGRDVFYSFQVDEENRMTNFFWRDGTSRLDYECFGDVVVFDTTYRTNKYNMICAPFVGVNNHWKNVLFGCAFLTDETISSFVWLFKTFLEAMGNKAPKTIFTDQDNAMANAILQVFPQTVHRLCVWHISKNATQHLSQLLGKPSFKEKFNKILHGCETEEEMESSWTELYEEWDLVENKWLSKLYSLRGKWCPAFNRDTFSAGIRSTQRSESTNNIFKQISCGTMTLTEFVNHYEKQAEKMREAQAMDDFECVRGRPRRIVNTGIMKHASEVYTLHIFRKFQDEFIAGMEWHVTNKHLEEASYTFVIVQEFGQRQHIVSCNTNEMTVACTCKLFESRGWLCRHALCVMSNHVNFGNIPNQYVLKRWTKHAREGVSIGDYYGSSSQDSISPMSLHLKELMRKSFSVMSLSAKDVETVRIAKRKLDELEDEIKSFYSSQDDIHDNDALIGHGANDTSKSIGVNVLDPQRRKPKGVSTSRFKSAVENGKRKKKKSQSQSSDQPSNFDGSFLNQAVPMGNNMPINLEYQNMIPYSQTSFTTMMSQVQSQNNIMMNQTFAQQ